MVIADLDFPIAAGGEGRMCERLATFKTKRAAFHDARNADNSNAPSALLHHLDHGEETDLELVGKLVSFGKAISSATHSQPSGLVDLLGTVRDASITELHRIASLVNHELTATIIEMGERFRAGERISTAFVESTVNAVIRGQDTKRNFKHVKDRGEARPLVLTGSQMGKLACLALRVSAGFVLLNRSRWLISR